MNKNNGIHMEWYIAQVRSEIIRNMNNKKILSKRQIW